MTAFDRLVTLLVTGGMEPAEAAALVARAVIEISATTTKKTAGAARQARWRERLKASQSVTEASPRSAVSVTSQPSQSVTSNASETVCAPLSNLTSSSFIESPLKEAEASPEPRARGRKLGARLPDDWEPSEADRSFAAAQGMRLVEIEIETTKFRNYWVNRTDRQASKPRWDLAWQNWILNRGGMRGGNGAAPRPGSKDDTRERTVNALRSLDPFPNRDEPGRGEGAGAAVPRQLSLVKPA